GACGDVIDAFSRYAGHDTALDAHACRCLDIDAAASPLAIDRQATKHDDGAWRIDRDAAPREDADSRVNPGRSDDRHRLSDRDGSVAAGLENDDLAAGARRSDGGGEVAARRDERARWIVRARRGHECALRGGSGASGCE